jgi:DNA-binding CsgD family transcriptional regulator/ketosteroid isomerase-like protein
LFERWFTAFNARDLDEMLALADPGIEMIPPANAVAAAPGATYHGHEGVSTLIGEAFRLWPRARMQSGQVEEVGTAVVVSMGFVLDDLAEPPNVRRVTTVHRFRDNRISLIHSFDTAAEAMRSIPAGEPLLTTREREVFQLLAEGLTTAEVADRLFLAPTTVRTHVQNGIDRLGVNTRVQAVAQALAHGEIEVEPE